jgi:hypothetical protein
MCLSIPSLETLEIDRNRLFFKNLPPRFDPIFLSEIYSRAMGTPIMRLCLVLLAASCLVAAAGQEVAGKRTFASEDSRREEAGRLFELAVSCRLLLP